MRVLLAFGAIGMQVVGADWQESPGFRWRPLMVGDGSKPGFHRLQGKETGIVFANRLSDERSLTNRNLLSGSGVALGDVDGDGLADIYFCGLDGENVLYRNRGGWRFEDITATAGIACAGDDSTGAALADVDADGDLDLLVNGLGSGTRLFQNDGKGKFVEITDAAGLRSKAGGTSMALADVDGDGLLDLYVTNFRRWTIKDQPIARFQGQVMDGRRVITSVDGVPTNTPELTNRFVISPSGEVLELGEPDVLYLNDGHGKFRAISFTGGAFLDELGKPLSEPPRDWGLAAQFHDFNADGAPDLYVCNDLFTPDRIWVNDGQGKFRALPELALRNTSTFSMGVDFADIDRDGRVDFFVVDMLSREHSKRQVQVGEMVPMLQFPGFIVPRLQVPRNNLQWNRGDGTFAEATYFAGLEASEWSWGPIFIDVDLDGYEDILVTNGQLRDFQNMDMANRIEELRASGRLNRPELLRLMREYPELNSPKVAFRNLGGVRFKEVGAAWGFDTAAISHGMALGDLDGDGDMDVVMNNLNGEAGVYRNEGTGRRVAVRLKGEGGNTGGIGGRIRLYGGPVGMQMQEMIAGGRYLSGDEGMRVFAGGEGAMRLEVDWRSGKRSVVEGVKANRVYEVNENGATGRAEVAKVEEKPWYEDVSASVGHVHPEEGYDDFGRQPLLPRKLSQLGPGVGFVDVDGDGKEELVIGSGRGGKVGVYRVEGGFKRMEEGVWGRVVNRDQTGLVGVEGTLIVGSANYEDGQTNGGCIRIYDGKRQASGESVMGQRMSVGALAMGDLDGDGDLDLFVGGRAMGGRWPEGVESLVLRNEGGRFGVWEKLGGVGMVVGAVMSDLDGDGKLELVLSCEWGPVRVMRVEEGRLVERTQEWGLSGLTGWWSGIGVGDLNNDGRLDLVVGNWGKNTKYRTSRDHPVKVYYGELGGVGLDVVEARYEEELKGEVAERGLKSMGMAFPWMKEKVGSFEAYGKSRLGDLFGERLKGARVVEANTLGVTLFMNEGGKFEARELGMEAQWAPVQGVCVGDADGDGNEDVYLSQNYFAVNPEMTRCDGGRGLWLKGDGKGGLEPRMGSGVKVYGEGRGAALGDYDEDGRLDLVVGQNGAETKVYRNVGGRPGLRVKMKGVVGNETGVGAKGRLVYEGGKKGPVKEVHAGGGYWSQDSRVLVFGRGSTITAIEVQWPGGKMTTSEVPATANEVEVDATGKVVVGR